MPVDEVVGPRNQGHAVPTLQSDKKAQKQRKKGLGFRV